VKKEVLIAIIIGFGLGLVITFGIWTANKNLSRQESSAVTPAPEPTAIPTPEPDSEFSLSIDEPENNFLSDQENLKISGQTEAGAIVVILYDEGEKILEADELGLFATEIDLTVGANQVRISAHDRDGNEAEESLTGVYSTADI
jgi:hypothetical protein